MALVTRHHPPEKYAGIPVAGGTQGLQQAALPANVHLPLKFRPADGLCRPLVGDKYSVRGLLVSVTRDSQDGLESFRLNTVARVNSSYGFSSLVDIQYVADKSLQAALPQVTSHLL